MKKFLKYVAVIIGFILCVIIMLIVSATPILSMLVALGFILSGLYLFGKFVVKSIVDDWGKGSQ